MLIGISATSATNANFSATLPMVRRTNGLRHENEGRMDFVTKTKDEN